MLKPVESERILAVVADEMDVEMSVITVRRRGCRLGGDGRANADQGRQIVVAGGSQPVWRDDRFGRFAVSRIVEESGEREQGFETSVGKN